MNILIVEDYGPILTAYEDIIDELKERYPKAQFYLHRNEKIDYNVNYDFAIIDWELGIKNASGIFEKIYKDVKQIFVVTKYNYRKELLEWMQHRNIEIISKPITADDFRAIINYGLLKIKL